MSRITLKPIVSNLREEIVKGISGKFEKYGFDKEGKSIIDKPLSEYDELIKSNMLMVLIMQYMQTKRKFKVIPKMILKVIPKVIPKMILKKKLSK